jgi:hypothetical protein
MTRYIKDRIVTFTYQDSLLHRTVSGPDGRSYTHRCDLAAFEIVAHAMDETRADSRGRTMGEIVAAEGLPYTKVDVVLAFLQDRGIIERRGRRNFPASASVHLDAMIEWHALREADGVG